MKLLVSSIFGSVGLFMVVFGCLFATAGGAVYYIAVYSLRDWVPVPGTVTTFQSSTSTNSDGFSSTTFCPLVQYTTASGETYEVRINECSSPRAYDVGDSVTVLYNPAAPGQAQLKGGTRESLGNILGIVFAVVGCVPMAVGLVLFGVGIVNAARRPRPGVAAVG